MKKHKENNTYSIIKGIDYENEQANGSDNLPEF